MPELTPDLAELERLRGRTMECERKTLAISPRCGECKSCLDFAAFNDALTALAAEREKLREALRLNVGDAYGLLAQGESPTQRRQPAARRIYVRSKAALRRAALKGAPDA